MSIFTINGSPVKYGNKWLENGGTPSSELPPYDSSDAGKALVVNDDGDGVEWQDVGSSGVVDQHYDSTSSNAQSGTAVAEALQTIPDELPPITGNAGKVLKVNTGETGVEWATESGGTVTDVQVNGTSVVSGGVADITVPAAQINSDWTASSGVAEILHKPTEKTLAAGSNVTITEANNTVTISATDTTYTAGKGVVIDTVNNTVRLDETVLWESSSATGTAVSGFSATLSEALNHFESYKIYWSPWSTSNADYQVCQFFTVSSLSVYNPTLSGTLLMTDSGHNMFDFWTLLAINGTSVSETYSCYRAVRTGAMVESNGNGCIFKIVGVNRIASA